MHLIQKQWPLDCDPTMSIRKLWLWPLQPFVAPSELGEDEQPVMPPVLWMLWPSAPTS